MATAAPTRVSTRPEAGEERFLLRDIGWDGYEALLAILGDHGPRVSYSDGNVELMSPLIPHERYKRLLGFMVEAITEELDIPRNALGSTTFKRQAADRGAEPDECYYIANAGRIGHQRTVDLEVDPPPDLVIEIEITSALLDKLKIYSGLRVPEIWKFDGEALTVLILQADGSYLASESSASFPFLPMGEIARFLLEFDPGNETGWGRAFRAWVRDEILPHYRRAEGA